MATDVCTASVVQLRHIRRSVRLFQPHQSVGFRTSWRPRPVPLLKLWWHPIITLGHVCSLSSKPPPTPPVSSEATVCFDTAGSWDTSSGYFHRGFSPTRRAAAALTTCCSEAQCSHKNMTIFSFCSSSSLSPLLKPLRVFKKSSPNCKVSLTEMLETFLLLPH